MENCQDCSVNHCNSMELESSITTDLEKATMENNTMLDIIGTVGVGQTLSFVVGVSETVGSKQVRKRRGRPRKWGFDGKRSSPTMAPRKVPSHVIDSFEERQIGMSRGIRKLHISASIREFRGPIADIASEKFIPHVVMVYPGQDVVEKIMTLFEKGYQGLSILSANGVLSCATIRHHDCVDILNYEGRYEILSLKGSYVFKGMSNANGRNGELALTLVNLNGEKVCGGIVEGPLIAASPVQVIVGTFKPNVKSKFKRYSAQSPAALRRISTDSTETYPAESSTTDKMCANGDLMKFYR